MASDVYHGAEKLGRNGGLVEETGNQDVRSQEDRRVADRQKVGVLGAGTMGSGIAITVARAGHSVVIREVSQDRVEAGLASVRKFLNRGVERGRMGEEQRDAAVSGMSVTTELEELAVAVAAFIFSRGRWTLRRVPGVRQVVEVASRPAPHT